MSRAILLARAAVITAIAFILEGGIALLIEPHTTLAREVGDLLTAILVGLLFYAWQRMRAMSVDATTGLFRRSVIEAKLAVCARRHKDITVAIIDVNGLKTVNDSRGHDTGDGMLKEVGRRLRSYKTHHPKAMVARLGGDEFAVLARKCEVGVLRQQMADLFQPEHEFGDFPLVVAGVARARLGHRDVLKCADLAMYRAKDEYYNNSVEAHVFCYDVILDGQPEKPVPSIVRRKRVGSSLAVTEDMPRENDIVERTRRAQADYRRVMHSVRAVRQEVRERRLA